MTVNDGADPMLATVLKYGFVPIAIGLSILLLRFVFPARASDPSSHSLTDDECRLYRRWELGSVLLVFLFALPLGFAWYLILRGLAGLFLSGSNDTRFLIQPNAIFWGIPAIFLGISTTWVPYRLLYGALLGDRFPRYERFCDERVGYDNKKVGVLVAALVLVASAGCFLAGVSSFAKFTEAGIEIRRPLSLRSKFYEYDRVRRIEQRATFQAPSGRVFEQPHYVIRFVDGSSWSTREGLHDPEPETDEPVLRFVSSRSQKAIEVQP